MGLNDTLGPVRYTNLDLDTILGDMVSAIPSVTDRWTDHSPSDIGIVILELVSWALDKLLYQLDWKANESFFALCQELKNAHAHARLIGYQPHGTVASSTILQISLPGPAGAQVVIPAFTRAATASDTVLVFSTMVQAIIPAGEDGVLVGVRQGIPKRVTFTADGTASQSFLLPDQSVDSLSVQVEVDDVVWVAIESFVAAQATDRQFYVKQDARGDTYVVFGDGQFGATPQTPQVNRPNIVVQYLVTAAQDGNVGSGTITTLLDQLLDVAGNPVSLSVTNPTAAVGGEGQETLEHIQRNAPASLAALDRAVTVGDFVALSENYPGIDKAVAWGEMESNPPDLRLMNCVLVTVSPAGLTREELLADLSLGQPSAELVTNLRQFLSDHSMLTTRIKIVPPVYRGVDVGAVLFVARGYLLQGVLASAQTALLAFFDLPSTRFGMEVYSSNVLLVLGSVPGVARVSLTRLQADGTETVADAIVSQIYQLPFLRAMDLSVLPLQSQPPAPAVYPVAPEPAPDPGF